MHDVKRRHTKKHNKHFHAIWSTSRNKNNHKTLTHFVACEYSTGFAKFSSIASWLLVPNEGPFKKKKRKTNR
jgi:hypothetical protein